MKKKNEETTGQKPLLYSDHKKPVTRRDFMASGLMGMSTMAFTSTAMSLVTGSAWAQSNCSAAEALMKGNVPFLCVDCAGGMNFAGGNALVGFAPNQFQGDFGAFNSADYRRQGIPDQYHPANTGMTNKTYGLKFHSSSGILQGMEEVLSPKMGETVDIREYVDGLLLCAITNDDTQTNPINTAYQAQKAGAIGQLVQLVGTQNSVNGGNSVSAPDQVNLTMKPSQLTSFASSAGLLSIGSNVMANNFLNATGAGGSGRLQRFMEQIARGGSSQRSAISGRSPAMLDEMAKYQDRQSGLSSVFQKFSPAALNPVTNPDPSDRTTIEAAYGKTIATLTQQEQMSANIINLLSRRTVGAGTISVGGGDYHNGTATTGADKDKEIGRYIGWSIRMAAARQVPFFIHAFTDGSVSGDAANQTDTNLPNRLVWRSDDGVSSAALMIVYNPKRKRVSSGQDQENSNFLLNGMTRQIGYFKPGGGNNLAAHSLVNNVNKLWIAVILNYLATRVNSTDDDEIRATVAEHFRCKFGELPPDWQKLLRFKSLIVA